MLDKHLGDSYCCLTKDSIRGTGVGGEPVKVFFGELFGGVAGSVEDAYQAGTVEDRHGQGIRPAGVGAGLREASGTGHHEGRLGGAEHKLYGAFVSRRERARRRGGYPRARLRDEGEVLGPYEADPVRLELLARFFGDRLWWGGGIGALGGGVAEDQAGAQDEVRARPSDYAQEGGDRVVGEIGADVLDPGIVHREVRSQGDDRHRVG